MKFLADLLFRTLVLLLTTYLVPGFKIDSFTTALMVALVLAILNILVKPLLVFFTLPVTIITLGLFLFVINAILLLITASLVRGFQIEGFGTAILAAIVISLLSSLLNAILK